MVKGSAVGLTSLYRTVKIKDTTHSQRYCFLRYHSSFCGFNAIFRRLHQKLHQLQQVATSPTRPRSSKKNLAKVTPRLLQFAVFHAEKTPHLRQVWMRGAAAATKVVGSTGPIHSSVATSFGHPQAEGWVWRVWTGFHDGHGCEGFGYGSRLFFRDPQNWLKNHHPNPKSSFSQPWIH